MVYSDAILLLNIAIAAFFVKGMTGFGPGIVVVALGSMVVPPHVIIPISAILDLVAGAALLRLDKEKGGVRSLLALGGTIMAGSIIGGITLKLISPEPFRMILAAAILVLGLWFIFYRADPNHARLRDELPSSPDKADYSFTFFGGVMGGFLGISGPPIIWHFGRKLAKASLRRILVIIFLAASIASTITYLSVGLIDGLVFGYSLICLPGLFLGLFLGNRMFMRVSEKAFSVAAGALLVVIAWRLLS